MKLTGSRRETHVQVAEVESLALVFGGSRRSGQDWVVIIESKASHMWSVNSKNVCDNFVKFAEFRATCAGSQGLVKLLLGGSLQIVPDVL